MAKRDLDDYQKYNRRLFRETIKNSISCPKCGAARYDKCKKQNGLNRASLHMERIVASKLSPYAIHYKRVKT